MFFMNVGDSRAVLSRRQGTRIVQCTEDHKPSAEQESLRILTNSGTIYR